MSEVVMTGRLAVRVVRSREPLLLRLGGDGRVVEGGAVVVRSMVADVERLGFIGEVDGGWEEDMAAAARSPRRRL